LGADFGELPSVGPFSPESLDPEPFGLKPFGRELRVERLTAEGLTTEASSEAKSVKMLQAILKKASWIG
jgi:hypothetical protein